ncbi:MAG TPA: methionine aminopeptidase [Pseudoneobacillus sp.]|nr:methionine aminopeptidase [Pseudoneobacillus sp.]
MGLMSSFNDWRASRYENHVSQMREENKCPDCYGRGFMMYPFNEFTYQAHSLECPGCNGSGLYTDWSSTS